MSKLYLFFVIISFIIGIGAVNDAYVDMTGNESLLLPQCRRINSEYVLVSGLGEAGFINTASISIKMNRTNYQLAVYGKNLIKDVKTRLGIQPEEEETREAYGIQIL